MSLPNFPEEIFAHFTNIPYLCNDKRKNATSMKYGLLNEERRIPDRWMYRLSESSLPYFCDVSLFKNLNDPALIDHIRRRGKEIYVA